MNDVEMLTFETVTEYDELPLVFRSNSMAEIEEIPAAEFKMIMEEQNV